MLKYLPTEWNEFAYDLEYPGTNDDKFFYYLRNLGYTGSVDDMLYEAVIDKGLRMDSNHRVEDVFPPPAVNAVAYNGTTDFLRRESDFTDNADGKSFIFSAWIRFDGGDGTTIVLFSNTSNRIILTRQSTGPLQFRTNNAAGTSIWRRTADHISFTTSPTWYHVLISVDYLNGKEHMYINDEDVPTAAAILSNDTAKFTGTTWGIAASALGTTPHNGAMAEVYFAPNQYLDFSIRANRRKFYSIGGKPADLGSDGSTPTGVAPLVYIKNVAATVNVNAGTGGDLTLNGEPTDDASPPSG